MRKRVLVLLVAGVGALAVPTATSAQLPPVPAVPPVPTVVPIPKPPVPVPVPTVVPIPKPPAPVPTVVPVPTSVPLPTVPGVTGPSGGGGSSGGIGGSTSSGRGGSSSSGGGAPTSSGGSSGAAATPSASSGGGGARGGSPSSGRGARARTADTSKQRHRAERRLRRTVTRLSVCLDNLSHLQRRVLVLRTGVGSARPHSRRGVARLLDLRVQRVVRLERRGLRDARRLSREGACGGGGGGATSTPTALAAGGSTGGGGGRVPEPDKGEVAGESAGHDSTTGAGDAQGEPETQLPPALGGSGGRDAGGVSLVIGITLILLAAVAGFATPHMRARVRSS